MTIFIRQAVPQDAPTAVPLIIEAIGDIAKRLTGESAPEDVQAALQELFIQENNRHSYLYTYVAVNEATNEVTGILVVYSGYQGIKLDQQLSKWLTTKNADVTQIDQEAYEDEFYIDTIAVHRDARGQGIGTALLTYAEYVARESRFSKIALNVEPQKTKAINLYKQLGFQITEPWTIIDEPFHHMVKTLSQTQLS